MSITSKGFLWEIRHSLWILWTLTIVFCWVAFLYIGIRTKQKKWIVYGFLYALPLTLTIWRFVWETSSGVDSASPMATIFILLTLLAGIISIFHAFAARPEFLLRIAALKTKLKQTIVQEYGLAETQHLAADGKLATNDKQLSVVTTEQQWREGNLSAAFPSSKQEKVEGSVPPPLPSPQRELLDLNQASEEELAALPGMGMVLAKKAIQIRQSQGDFSSFDQFCQALVLKEHTKQRLQPLVVVHFKEPEPPSSNSGGRVLICNG